MQRIVFFAMAALLTFGCAATTQEKPNCQKAHNNCQKAAPQGLVQTIGDDYMVWEHAGRIYVIGQAKTNSFFAEHRHLPYTKTLIGAGPRGETVIFEVNKKDAALVPRLMEIFLNTPYPLDSEGADYNVLGYQGRLFVLGQASTVEKFMAHKHLPYTRTLLGAGPQGQTVIFEVAKKNPDLTDRLQKVFAERPFPLQKSGDDFFVYHYDGRIYVIGSAETNAKFLQHKHLPYTRTLLGAGPHGETVIFEVDKKQPALTERLEEQYL